MDKIWTFNGNIMKYRTDVMVTGSAEPPEPPGPPIGNYTYFARIYTYDNNTSNITLNTVSWVYDSGSPATYADAACIQELYDLSEWYDSSANTVLPVAGNNQYGKYVDIFTQGTYLDGVEPQLFCLILGNDNVETISDDSWRVTRVEVYDNNGNMIYAVNSDPYKGQWFRDETMWIQG